MPDRAAVRSSLLAHPVALLALVTLVVNDHLLKTAAPGFLTGKLSDVAGLVVVPVLVAELLAVAGRRVGRREGAPSMVPWTAFATGLGFAAVKLTPIGAEAFALGLGAAQWIATLGFLRAAPILAVPVIQDPTDVLALPALVLPILVARGFVVSPAPRQRARVPWDSARLMGAALGLAAGTACLATTQAVPRAVVSAGREVTLDPAHPVAALDASWLVHTGEIGWDGASFEGSVSAQDGRLPGGVELIAASDTLPAPPEGTGAASRRIPLPPCHGPCTGSATLVVHADPSAFTGDSPLSLTVTALVPDPTGDTASAAHDPSTMTLVPADAFAAVPTVVSSPVSGTVRVTADDPSAVVRLQLVVDAAALARGRGWPLVGRLAAEIHAPDDAAAVRWLTGRVDGLPEVVALEPEVPVLVDWLRSCPKTGECRISIDLLVTDNGSNDKDPNGTLVSWSAEARLEAFDGRPLADGAVELQHR